MTPRRSIFHALGNGVLNCFRDRIDDQHKHVVDDPDKIVAALGTLPTIGFILDLVGHAMPGGFLRFGSETIDASPRFVKLFQDLRTAGVTKVRLLGCEARDTTPGRTALRSLEKQSGIPKIVGTHRDLSWRDYNLAGLRPTSEPLVFGFGPNPQIKDPAYPLTLFLSGQPLSPRPSAARITTTQLEQLEHHVAPEPWLVCPHAYGVVAPSQTLRTFDVELSQNIGCGSVVQRTNGDLAVLALNARGVELVYDVAATHRDKVRNLIAGWG